MSVLPQCDEALMHLMSTSVKDRKVVAAVMQYRHRLKLQFFINTTGVISSALLQQWWLIETLS